MSLRIYLIILLPVLSLDLFSSDILINETKELITESMDYIDFNPIYSPYTDSLKNMLITALNDYDINTSQPDKEQNKLETFKHFDRNAMIEYEDSQDIIRIKMRRAYCLGTLALLSDSDKSLFYIDLANQLLIDELNPDDIEIISKHLIGLKLIDIFIKLNANSIKRADIKDLKEITVKSFEFVPESYYKKTSSLIKKLESSSD